MVKPDKRITILNGSIGTMGIKGDEGEEGSRGSSGSPGIRGVKGELGSKEEKGEIVNIFHPISIFFSFQISNFCSRISFPGISGSDGIPGMP